MRFLHLGLVVSLVLTTKASDDPNHNDSLSENPTGRAAVHGHPKVTAGFGRQKPIAETPLMSSEADSEEHTMPPVMTEDNTIMLSEEVQLTNAHESNEAMIEEISEHDKVISDHKITEALLALFPGHTKDQINEIPLRSVFRNLVPNNLRFGDLTIKTAKQNLICQNGEATGLDFPPMVIPSGHLTIIIDRFICLCDQNNPENACISCRHIPDGIFPGGIFFQDKTFHDHLFSEDSFTKSIQKALFIGRLPSNCKMTLS